MTTAQTITQKLTAALSPETLEVVDESAKHHGHSGARPEGETHFYVRAISSHFAGLSKVKRHQLVYTILAEELRHPVHALSLALYAPDELAK